jgi:hypothetical protein
MAKFDYHNEVVGDIPLFIDEEKGSWEKLNSIEHSKCNAVLTLTNTYRGNEVDTELYEWSEIGFFKVEPYEGNKKVSKTLKIVVNKTTKEKVTISNRNIYENVLGNGYNGKSINCQEMYQALMGLEGIQTPSNIGSVRLGFFKRYSRGQYKTPIFVSLLARDIVVGLESIVISYFSHSGETKSLPPYGNWQQGMSSEGHSTKIMDAEDAVKLGDNLVELDIPTEVVKKPKPTKVKPPEPAADVPVEPKALSGLEAKKELALRKKAEANKVAQTQVSTKPPVKTITKKKLF